MMDKIIINAPLQINTEQDDASLDAREFVETEQDIYNIECPHEGLIVYVRDSSKFFVVTSVGAAAVNGQYVGRKVKEYRLFQSNGINYRGEFTLDNLPQNPTDGDWYRNTTYGKTYIMQNGAWCLMAQDGVNGIDGDKGDKGETGDKGQKGEKGEKGDPGEDAPYQEFIYLLTDWKAGEKDVSQIRMPEYTNEEYQHDDFINLLSENKRHGWTDSPRGVSSDMLTEWVSHRRKASTNGMTQWGELSSPVPWSVWGVNGTDGDGITYIFCKSAKEPNEFLKTDWGTILVFSDDEISSGKHTHIDGIPESAKEAGWTDNPENTDATDRFIYVAIRRRITNADGIAEWQTYFTTPTLWASYGQKGDTGDPGPEATFDFYELLPSASTITATFDQATSRITKISPTSLRADLKKITQSGSQITNTLADAELIVSAYTYEESVSDDKIYNLSVAVPNIDLLEWWGYEIPAYVEMQLKLNGTVFDTKRIPVQYSFTGVSATMPDWVDEWNDPNSKAQFNGQNVLAVRAYIGDQPKPSELWSGILIGSSIANVDGLHWDEDPINTYDFSGILAVKNFDPSVGDNIIGENNADISFALDAKTGNAYFKGTVYATDGEFNGTVYATKGKFTGEIEATSGKFENGKFDTCEITNSSATNLTVIGGQLTTESDSYKLTIGSSFDDIITIASKEPITIDGVQYENWEPIATLTKESSGKTGSLCIVDRTGKDGYYSKAVMSGGNFSVSYSDSLAFGESDNTTVVGISQQRGVYSTYKNDLQFELYGGTLKFYDNGGQHYIVMPNIVSANKNGHQLSDGTLFVDEEGLVRVAYNGAYKRHTSLS